MQAMGPGLHAHGGHTGVHRTDLRDHPVWGVVVVVAALAALWALGLLIYSVLLPLTG